MTTANSTTRPQTPSFQRRHGGRTILVVLLIAGMLLTTLMRSFAASRREVLVPRPPSQTRMGGVDTFALGLILGGLRGPLAMILWTKIENQKADKDLEDVDTMIELVRMLQPEFASVHIFQMWNKAYNLSVQMSSLANKYSTILDALRYGHSVLQENPDDVNILVSMGEIYFNKLGQSAEKRYYVARVRRETLPHARVENRESLRPIQLDPMLDEHGMILPELLQTHAKLAPSPMDEGASYNGAELQFLEQFCTPDKGGFPYGISPVGLGYNYYKRASVLMNSTSQRHLQLSDSVIDSRPAISSKIWAEEEWERARRLETVALGLTVPDDRNKLEVATQAAPLTGKFASGPIRNRDIFSAVVPGSDQPRATADVVREALYTYSRAADLVTLSVREYRRHISNGAYVGAANLYQSHIDNAECEGLMFQADHDYLAIMASNAGLIPLPPDQLAQLKKQGAERYLQTMQRYQRHILRYYIPDDLALTVYPKLTKEVLGKEYTRANIDKADPKIYTPLLQASLHLYNTRNKYPIDEVVEYGACIERASTRLQLLQAK